MEPIELGFFGRPVGLKGELKFVPAPDFWNESLDSECLELRLPEGTRSVRVERSRAAGANLVLRLSGVEDRSAAEGLKSAGLLLVGEPDVPLPERPLPFQVHGMQVYGAGGEALGEVIGLLLMPAQPLLQVRDGEREYSIPFIPPILSGIDWEKGRIDVDPPPGLLEL
jgi:16S rRNA processing protein RimM